jgi:L-lactate dehydrogenase complex protein LldE
MAHEPIVKVNVPLPKGAKVALFITCLTDQFYPRVGVAVTKILEKLGYRVEFPGDQTCCGQPFFNNGFTGEARELARRMIEVFWGYEYVVTPSGSCAAMVREHFPTLFKGDGFWEERANSMAGRTFEFVEFLEKEIKVDLSKWKLPTPRAVTYHYTCHQRGLGMTDEAVTLLRAIGNVEFRPMEKAEQCCGFGGTFAVKYPAVSGAIVEDKVKCLAASGAATVICNDAGCAMNISGMCHRQGKAVEVTHIAQLIAEAMDVSLDGWE